MTDIEAYTDHSRLDHYTMAFCFYGMQRDIPSKSIKAREWLVKQQTTADLKRRQSTPVTPPVDHIDAPQEGNGTIRFFISEGLKLSALAASVSIIITTIFMIIGG